MAMTLSGVQTLISNEFELSYRCLYILRQTFYGSTIFFQIHGKINFALQHGKINFALQHGKINFALQHGKINFALQPLKKIKQERRQKSKTKFPNSLPVHTVTFLWSPFEGRY
jgi:hypothetical protein